MNRKTKGILLLFLVLIFSLSAKPQRVRTIRYKIDSIQVSNSSSCLVCNGAATAWVSGGFTPYTYLWNNSATTQSISGLCPGTYSIMVVDSNRDTISGTRFIGPSSPHAVDSVKSTCINTGIASVYAFGGTGQYTYSWSNGATTSQIAGVTAATYTVMITDSNGCKCADTAIVPAGLHFNLSYTNVTCNADSNGSATISNVTDGTGPYTYNWAPVSGTNSAITGLLAGTYTVTVIDNTGCRGIDSVNINQPPPLVTVYDTIADTGSCSGKAMIYISGGFSPYTFSWLPNVTNKADTAGADSAMNLCHGVYFFCATDAHGCSVCDSVYIRNSKLSAVTDIKSTGYNITLYPNPNKGEFTISLSHVVPIAIGMVSASRPIVEVYNTLGQKVFDATLKQVQGDNTIDVSNLPSGTYMLKLSDTKNYSIKPFIIKKNTP
jgi:hypothetical protein